jgi:hypothetical protein
LGVRRFLAERNRLYFATLSDAGWYRAAVGDPASGFRSEIRGPRGFLRVIDDIIVGWADLGDDLRHLRPGNMESDRGAALFAIDDVSGERVEIFGRARIVHVADEPELIAAISVRGDDEAVRRGIIVTVAALNWKAPARAVADCAGDS